MVGPALGGSQIPDVLPCSEKSPPPGWDPSPAPKNQWLSVQTLPPPGQQDCVLGSSGPPSGALDTWEISDSSLRAAVEGLARGSPVLKALKRHR